MKYVSSSLVVISCLFFLLCFGAVTVRAQQSPMRLGKVSAVTQLSSCSNGFFPGMTCFHAEMSCPNTVNIGLSFGELSPTQAARGTIVFLEGGPGTTPFANPDYGSAYLAAGYQIVELAWDTPWEITQSIAGNNIKNAACRPATFLKYVRQNVYQGGGMCAQGDSAGSGAVAYTLAWYGGSVFLDKVELLSGPVFGDIEQGCAVPNGNKIAVCPPGQFGCNGAEWLDGPEYVFGAESAVGRWSGDRTCNSGVPTSATSNSKWKQMSIVDGTTSPSFVYPHTALAGWLCSDIGSIQNNSAAEGEFFYQQFTSPKQAAGYSLTRIDNCNGDEGVSSGQTPQGLGGFAAISSDMIAGCIKRH